MSSSTPASDLSLYGLFARLSEVAADSEDATELKTLIQGKLAADPLELTGAERKTALTYVQKLVAKARSSSEPQLKIDRLSALEKKISSQSLIQKEPRNVRKLAWDITQLETQYEEANETLEKWRAGKYKLKNVAEADKLVSTERELRKDLAKSKEKLETMRRTRSTFGSLDSDDDFGKKKVSSWVNVSAPIRTAVPNPAASSSRSKTTSSNKTNPAKHSGPAKWNATDMTLAQQLQMRMVADLKGSEEEPTASGKENPEGILTSKTSSNGAAPGSSEDASGSGMKGGQKGSADEELFAEETSSQPHVNGGGKSGPNKQAFDGFEPVKKKQGKKGGGGPGGLAQQAQAGKSQQDSSDSDSDTVDPQGDGKAHQEESNTKTSGGNNKAANKKRNKNKGANAGSQQHQQGSNKNTQEKEDWALPKQNNTSQQSKANPNSLGSLFRVSVVKNAGKELWKHAALANLLGSTSDSASTSTSSTSTSSASSDAQQQLTELQKKLHRNPCGLGPPSATKPSAYQKLFTKFTISLPIQLNDKPATTYTSASSKKNASSQPQVLVDTMLGQRIRQNAFEFYPIFANMGLLFMIFIYYFLSGAGSENDSYYHRRARNNSASSSSAPVWPPLWATLTFLIAAAQSVVCIPEAFKMAKGKWGTDLVLRGLQCTHALLWCFFAIGVVSVFSLRCYFFLACIFGCLLSCLKFEKEKD
ncbi:unnamed protein product [Amoebophrya sp. A25]|nr:unnamed protein product [Amoebophrya sp. A25]|eukprot:GSA25T00007212001.1